MTSYAHTRSWPQVSVSVTHLRRLHTWVESWHTLGGDVNVPYRSMLSVILTLISALNISQCDYTSKCPQAEADLACKHLHYLHKVLSRTNRRVNDATLPTKGNVRFKGKLLCPKPGFINIVYVSGSSVREIVGTCWKTVAFFRTSALIISGII